MSGQSTVRHLSPSLARGQQLSRLFYRRQSSSLRIPLQLTRVRSLRKMMRRGKRRKMRRRMRREKRMEMVSKRGQQIKMGQVGKRMKKMARKMRRKSGLMTMSM